MSQTEQAGDEARDIWSRKLTSASLTLAPPVNAKRLAQEFGVLDDDRRDELCNEAAMACIRADESEVSMEHFRSAFEGIDDDQDTVDIDDVENDDEELPEAATESNLIEEPEMQEPPEESDYDAFDEDTAADTASDDVEASSQADEELSEDAHEPVEELPRDELEAEVQQLRNEVDKLQEVANRDMAYVKGALTNFFDVDDVEELPDAGQRFREDITNVHEDVDALDGVISDGGGGKEGKIAQIVQLASNRRRSQPVVKMTASDIVDATGVSRRYAYDLIEDLPDEYDWMLGKEEMRQYGDLELDKDSQTKSVGIDFTGERSSGCPVNKFTTRSD